MKPTLNRFFAAFATFLAAVALALSPLSAGHAAQEGVLLPSAPKELPDLTYLSAGGTPVSLSTHEGKVVVLHFWAKWCPPCIDELPEMAAMMDGIDIQHKDDVVFLPISLDRDPETVRNFLMENDLRLPVLRDDGGSMMRALKVRGLPSTLLLNRHGEEIARREGVVDWDDAAVRGAIMAAIAPVEAGDPGFGGTATFDSP